MKKVIVILTHERSEGSTIVGVVPYTVKGRKIAEHLKAEVEARANFTDADVVRIESVEVTTNVRGPSKRPTKCPDCGHAKHGVYCMDATDPVHCRCKRGMRAP
jgi:hypothetical protein